MMAPTSWLQLQQVSFHCTHSEFFRGASDASTVCKPQETPNVQVQMLSLFFFPGGTDASATPPRILLKMHFGELNLITTPATVILIGPKYTSATLPRIPRDISDALWEL